MKNFVLLTTLLSSLSLLSISPADRPGHDFPALLDFCRQGLSSLYVPVELAYQPEKLPNTVIIPHTEIQELILSPNRDISAQLDRLKDISKQLSIKSDGRMIPAATMAALPGETAHHYQNAWVRDSVWAILGLLAQEETQARGGKLLVYLADFYGTDLQLTRLINMIRAAQSQDSSPLFYGGAHPMVRFHVDKDGHYHLAKGPDGNPQDWDHRQFDAHGMFFDLILKKLMDDSEFKNQLSDSVYKALKHLPAYFYAISYHDAEDAGAWEELIRKNFSSVAMIVSALEKYSQVLTESQYNHIRNRIISSTDDPYLERVEDPQFITEMIEKGYQTIDQYIKYQGESPLYHVDTPKYRSADIAMLNAIYPADLTYLTTQQKASIYNLVTESLVNSRPQEGPLGVHRYHHDSYQGPNYWFRNFSDKDVMGDTGFTKRHEIVTTEGCFAQAQWFFPSWISLAAGVLFQETQNSRYSIDQIHYFNLALGQITPKGILGADGRPVTPGVIGESYAPIFDQEKDTVTYLPSPLTPLNWAHALFHLAKRKLRKVPTD